MADEQNVIQHGLNAAKANAAEDQEAQQQVQQLASQLGGQAGTAAQNQTETAADANME
ncbi:hypothetical protein LJK88_23680 [Paenibacillus sp. P26]|nr:hypothetical protein LJK88_23680 [Paenibacillus sp. P26]UUZ95496.1 hypothetical protein LJK87_14205 [Paenibacillus sp. P25]